MAAAPTNEPQAVALKALSYLCADERRAGAFLGASGLSPDELKTRLRDPEFLGFVLDMLLQDEEALLDFCAAHDFSPETPAAARARLPGGDAPHWT